MSKEITMLSDESMFLRRLFETLNVRGIVYAVARRMPSLPESLDGSDLDVMVPSETELVRLVGTVKEVAQSLNGGFTSIFKGDYASFRLPRAYIASLAGRYDNGNWWGLHIDMYVGADFHGIEYMDSSMIMAGRTFVNGCYWCLGNLSDVSNFVKEILHNGRMKKNYRELAKAAYSFNRDAAHKALERHFGDMVNYIEHLLFKYGDESFKQAQGKLRRALVWQCGVANAFMARSANLFYRAKRFFNPPGFFLVVLGTDGSGKSTIINVVTPFLENMTHLKVEYHHLRPCWLPSLSRLTGKPQKPGPVTDPHGGKAAGRLSSILRFFYYYVDYTLGHLVNIHLVKAKRSVVIIGDRWYYEYIIDPRRCAVRLPKWMPQLFMHLIPKPDFILCLGGDPEKIYARKPETSLEEVKRQVTALKKFCDGNHRAVWIDTTKSIEESANAALTAILERMARRCVP